MALAANGGHPAAAVHRPDHPQARPVGIFSFSYVVQVHNILALLLVLNAGLSLFYHLASGEIKAVHPRPRGFLTRPSPPITCVVFSATSRIPSKKTRERKLKPACRRDLRHGAQRAAAGADHHRDAHGVQRWLGANCGAGRAAVAGAAAHAGGLELVAFIILHVYLTTTGPTPVAGIQAMKMLVTGGRVGKSWRPIKTEKMF